MYKTWLLTLAAFGTLTVQAATLTLLPTSQNLNVGDTGSVAVQVTGLTANQAVGAFDLTVLSDPAIVSATSVIYLGALGNANLELTGSSLTAGLTNVAETSFETTATLLGLQAGQPLSLFQITYSALSPGTSQLLFGLSPRILADGTGGFIPITTAETASITVQGTEITPEPKSLGLLTGGMLVLLAAFRLRRSEP